MRSRDVLGIVVVCLMSLPMAAAAAQEFWAALSQVDGVTINLSVVVGNPDPGNPVDVTVETEAGIVDSATVAPLDVHRFNLGPDRKSSGSGLAKLGYRIRSDRPVNAYQLAGFELTTSSNGASLLVDRRTWGTAHIVAAMHADTVAARSSVVTIVAAEPTKVQVVTSDDVQPGSGVPAIAAGAAATFNLDAFDVLQLASEASGDLTGTTVSSDAPVEVFAGCLDCILPNSAAETSQDTMPPLQWWSKSYSAASSSAITLETNRWRIVAAEDGTTVTTDPPVAGTPVVLDRAGWVELLSATDFQVSATAPVLMLRIVSGGGPSDPAMSVMLAPERFATEAVFALSDEFPSLTTRWIDIVAPPGASVVVDGTAVPAASYTAIGPGNWLHAQVRLATTPTVHRLSSDMPVGAYAGFFCCSDNATFTLAMGFPQDLPPLCNSGGPYDSSCAGPVSRVALSAALSRDPEGLPLSYSWSSSAPEVAFDDPSLPDATASVSGLGSFPLTLEVSDAVNSVRCSTMVAVTGDPTPPPELPGPAAPLWLAKSGSNLLFSWLDLGAAPIVYNVYQGDVGAYWSHRSLSCGLSGTVVTPGRREAPLPLGSGSVYFQVSASGCAAEGPTAGDSSLSDCPP